MKAILLMINLCLLCAMLSYGQMGNDTVFHQAYNNAIKHYKNFLQDEIGLYNGPVYMDYTGTISHGSPFLGDTALLSNGHVAYNGVSYENIPLLYDIYENKLITAHPLTKIRYSLINEKVDAFSLLGYYFQHLKPDSIYKIKPGYYETLYNGTKSSAYQRHEKETRDDLTGTVVKIRLNDKNVFYIKNRNTVVPVNSKKNILKIYDDKEKEISHFMRTEKLKFRKSKREDLIKITRFYNEL